MRVCIINEFFYPDSTGGTGTVLSDLAKRLTDEHSDVHIDVITSTNLYRNSVVSLSAYEEWNDIRIHRIPSRHPNGLSMPARLIANIAFTLQALQKLRQLGKYDLVLIGTAPPMVAFAATIFKKLTGTPFVYIVYDLEPDRSVTMHIFGKNHPFVWLFRQNQASWLRSANRIVTLGRCMKEHISEVYSLPHSKVDVIPIGANEHEISPGAKTSTFRKKNGIDGFVVLYTGNFGRYHNFDTILDAAKALNSQNSVVQFVLVGGGAQKEHITSRIENEKITNTKVYSFVATEEYSDLLASADVSLVTLEPGMEGLCVPSKFYSILASGRPVVGMVSPKSEVARVIEESSCGWQVAQGDSQKLVEVLTWLSSHPADGDAMGQRARDVLVKKYGTNTIANQYYQSFLAACNLSLPSSRSTPGSGESRSFSTTLDAENCPQNEPVTIDSQ